MVLRYALVLLFLNCVRTAENVQENPLVKDIYSSSVRDHSVSPYYAVKTVRLRRDEHKAGGTLDRENKSLTLPAEGQPLAPTPHNPTQIQNTDLKLNNPKGNISNIVNKTAIHTPFVSENNTSSHNSTITKEAPSQLSLSNPGVLKRGLIVFGGFGLMAIAYYVFFKRTKNKNSINSMHNSNDTNQFRYGVLKSDDQRDNLELSRIPLTMDSDEDDDEDLEIFDIEQKKKSLSYVNLQPNDDNLDVSSSNFIEVQTGHDGDNLLLDIDTNDTLINWSNNHYDNNFNAN